MSSVSEVDKKGLTELKENLKLGYEYIEEKMSLDNIQYKGIYKPVLTMLNNISAIIEGEVMPDEQGDKLENYAAKTLNNYDVEAADLMGNISYSFAVCFNPEDPNYQFIESQRKNSRN